MTVTNVRGYSPMQVALHWTVVVLIVFQLLAHEGMEESYRAYQDGEAPETGELTLAWLHATAGVLVLLSALARLYLRNTRGVPPLPEKEPAAQKLVARTTHYLLYTLIIVMPLTGAAAWLFGIEQAGDVHEFLKNVLIAVVVLHIAGALFEHFVMRTDVLKRMLKPQRGL